MKYLIILINLYIGSNAFYNPYPSFFKRSINSLKSINRNYEELCVGEPISYLFFNTENSTLIKQCVDDLIQEQLTNYTDKYINDTEIIYNNSKVKSIDYYKFGLYPRLDSPNENGELTWYPIGLPGDFNSYTPKRITIRDVNYSIWKDKNNTYYALRDACSHQGASLSKGCIRNNKITCPYHGYEFDGSNGNLTSIPYYTTKYNDNFNMNYYNVIEKKGLVFLNTVPLKNENVSKFIDTTKIWVEPEAYNNTFKEVILTKKFHNYAKLVSVNSLDICHISFVHTFGNKNSPNPLNEPVIEKVNDNKYHFKITYQYKSGTGSIVSKIFNIENLTVENEFILPHTTIARVKFGDFVSTVVTNAVPTSKFETKLFVKAYRNYWYTYPDNDIFNPFLYITNYFGNYITSDLMKKTLNEDKEIIDNIDKYDYESMHGKFSIKFDKLSNLYKHYYKKFYENGKKEI
jgi:phenylpropionate dioxygenase-like ring-hydroxylating dioxygenase large terminal subunit